MFVVARVAPVRPLEQFGLAIPKIGLAFVERLAFLVPVHPLATGGQDSQTRIQARP